MINLIQFSGSILEYLVAFLFGVIFTSVLFFIYKKYIRSTINPFLNIAELNSKDSPLYALINNLPDNIFVKDISGRYIIANDSFAQQLKYDSASEIIGKTDADLYIGDSALKYIEEDKKIIFGELKELKREQMNENSETPKKTITRKYPIKSKTGKVIGIVGICSDITDQFITQKKLQDKNEQIEKERILLRTLMDSIPDNIYIKDKNCNFIDVNVMQIAAAKGGNRENMIGKSDYDFYPKDMAEGFFNDDKSIIETGMPLIGKEEVGFDKFGNLAYKSTTKVPFFDESGNILGLVGIGRDITKIKEHEELLIQQAQDLQEVNVLLEERQEEINQQAEELSQQNIQLETERSLLRSIIDNIPDFIFIKDKNSSFITANNNMLKNFDLPTHEDIVGKSDFDFFPKEMAKKFFSEEQNIIKTGKPFRSERTSVDSDGNILHLYSTKFPYKGTNGEIEGIVGIAKDITEIKEKEIKLKEQAEYLNEVNVLLEERQEEIQQQSEELSSQNRLLENERNLLRVIIDNIPDSIFVKDTNSRFIAANKSLKEKLNIASDSDIEGKTDYDFYPREQADSFLSLENEVIASKKPVIDHEEIKITSNGEKRYRNVTKVPFYDDENRILGIVGLTKDITELKNYQNQLEAQAEDLKEVNQLLEERSEEILKQSEWLEEQNRFIEKERAQLRTLIDNMPDFIYIKDKESKFITVNKRVMEIFHIDDLDKIIGKTDLDLYPEQNAAREYYNDELKIIKTGKSLINKEEIGYDESGRKRVVSTTKVPLRDIDGKIVGIVGIGRDITKQKTIEKKLIEQAKNLNEVNSLLEERQEKIQEQSETLNKQAEELKESNSKLKELNATKNKFFSIIAHDLKNPFQAIFGFSELLMRNFEDFEEEQRLELLGMIKTSSEGAYNLLENLLQWARSQTDRIKYTPAFIDIHDVINQNVILSQPSADKKGISIRTNLDCTKKVWADFNMINLVIRNIISNAIKFTGNNGFITVICSDYSTSEIKIDISDSGIGISKDNIKKLFRIDEYFSTNGTAGESGTGLGLIICNEFIDKNNGKLSVESVQGEGTTFSFTLPKSEK